jgi:hypothetical protein
MRALYALAALILAGSTWVAVDHGGWSWWLFVWGVLLGCAQVVMSLFIRELAYGISEVPPEVRDATRAAERERYRPLYWLFAAIGVATGVEAAGLESRSPDLSLTVVVIVFGIVLPALLLPRSIARMKARA